MTRVKTLGLCTAMLASMALALPLSASAAPPEFGRCLKVATGTGAYGSGNCTTTEGEHKNWEWSPGPGAKAGFTLTLPGTFLEGAVSKAKVSCTNGTGTGEITGPTSVGNVNIAMFGCEPGGTPCETAGHKNFEIVMEGMTGELGRIKAGKTGPLMDQVGLTLGNEWRFVCAGGAVGVVVTGSIIGVISPTHGMATLRKWSFKVKKGKGVQIPERFEGGIPQGFTMTVNGTPEGGGFSSLMSLTSEEKIEINTVI
jgi:hypothetical protein